MANLTYTVFQQPVSPPYADGVLFQPSASDPVVGTVEASCEEDLASALRAIVLRSERGSGIYYLHDEAHKPQTYLTMLWITSAI